MSYQSTANFTCSSVLINRLAQYVQYGLELVISPPAQFSCSQPADRGRGVRTPLFLSTKPPVKFNRATLWCFFSLLCSWLSDIRPGDLHCYPRSAQGIHQTMQHQCNNNRAAHPLPIPAVQMLAGQHSASIPFRVTLPEP